jgi:cyclopropane fatty-acyl-phospholipid synthase-like methyltransferase
MVVSTTRRIGRNRTHGAMHGDATVVACYAVFDRFFPACGLLDMTEGIYGPEPGVSYEAAQANQARHLLDELQCAEGTRVLDVGCGYGTLLEHLRERKGRGVGITVSPEQVRHCRRRGLDVRLLDYRALDETWEARFDSVAANGPMEHFVQPAGAVRGEADAVYRRFFAIVHRLIDPRSPVRRFVNTTIHFVRRPDPSDLLRSPFSFPRGSDRFHYALLARSFGGWYPEGDQLERCAAGYFELVKTVDGTADYCRTSEEWLRRVRQALGSRKLFRILARALPLVVRHPFQLATMLLCMLGTESWNWQFRGPDPPTRLLRQTWEYREDRSGPARGRLFL